MKKIKIILIISSIFTCLIVWHSCQKDMQDVQLSAEAESTTVIAGNQDIDCTKQCINPADPVYYEMSQQEIASWGKPPNPFTKTTCIEYYNTLTHFVLRVKSCLDISDVLMDDESIKNFKGTIPPDTWQEFLFPLADDWQACDNWSFELKVTGFGPPAYFDVEYQLIGECGWRRDTQTMVKDVLNPATGKTWMDRNLGASRAATGSNDAEAYGDLYQWGRAADGHQKRNSGTTSTLSSSDTPGHGNFILSNSGANWDWRSPQNENLWDGVNGTNNPCPTDYRLPTEAELEAERASWSSNNNNSNGAFGSPLKLPVAGFRDYSDGSLYDVGSYGFYWSSTVGDIYSRTLYFYSDGASMSYSFRAFGYSVRCLKDN